MRLCFGTFAMVLNRCRHNISQALLITKLMIIVDPSKQYIGEATTINIHGEEELKGDDSTAHKYLHCKTNFVFSDNKIANSLVLNDIIQKFGTEISPYIDEDKKNKVIFALLKIIQEDIYIDSEKRESFKKYFGIEKTLLLQKSKFVFSDFLGRILFYTVLSGVNNKDGRECVKDITSEYIETIVQPYIHDYQWDKSTETLTLSYLEMFNLLQDAISEYQINTFIEKIDPTNYLNFEWIEKAEAFCDYIKNKIISPFQHDSELVSSKMLDFIVHFVNDFNEYLTYTGRHTRPLAENPDIMVPIYRDENMKWAIDFNAKVEKYRKQIIFDYQEIYDYALPFITHK